MSAVTSFSLAELAAILNVSFQGDAATRLAGIAPLATAGTGHLSFCSNSRFKAALQNSRASAVILPPELAVGYPGNCLVTTAPYFIYATLSALFDPLERPRTGVRPDALAAADDVYESACIGANYIIEQRGVLGADAVIGLGTVIASNTRLGKNRYIHANDSVYHDISIGDDAVIHSGAVIGSNGFGFTARQGGWQNEYHLGRLNIGNQLEIHA